MSTGLWIALAALVVALAYGAYRRYADGRFRERRTTRPPAYELPSSVVSPLWAHVLEALPEAELGDRATLLQFSSAFCAPCRTTRVTLAEVAGLVTGVVHVEVDAEQHLDLVRALGILKTPTTLVLDQDGREITRATGAPRREQVLAAISRTNGG